MAREQYRTPDEDVAAEFERVSQLFRLALGRPSDRVLFDSLMSEANSKGMNWVEGLEYVVTQRGRVDTAATDALARRRVRAEQTAHCLEEFRRAG